MMMKHWAQTTPKETSLNTYCRAANEYREKMLEAAADLDDTIMEKYLGKEDIGVDEIKAALRKGTLELKLTPVLCGSAFRNKGVQLLLDGIVDYLPSPLDIPPVSGKLPNE